MADKEFKSWAIHSRSKEGHGFIGPLWWFGGVVPKAPIQFEGCNVALFTTRKTAKEALKDVRRSFPKAVVERVTVIIKAV